MRSTLGPYSLKHMKEDLDEFDKFMAGKPSAFWKIPLKIEKKAKKRKYTRSLGDCKD
jgi:hypothetical protein